MPHIVCRDTVSSDMFLPSLTSWRPRECWGIIYVSCFIRPAGPRPAPGEAVGSWSSGDGLLLEMLLD